MNGKKKKYLIIGVLVLIVAVFCYAFCPMSIRMSLCGLKGEQIYEYQYSDIGRAVILLDGDETVSFIDTNVVGPLGVRGIRGYVVYDLQNDKIAKVKAYDKPANQYGYVIDYEGIDILVSIQIPKNENGVPDLHLYQFGLSSNFDDGDDILFQTEVFGKTIFARYVTSW